MATSCPTGYVPDRQTGLCKPTNSNLLGEDIGGGAGGGSGVAALPNISGAGASGGVAMPPAPRAPGVGGRGAAAFGEMWPESNNIASFYDPDPGDDGTVHGGPEDIDPNPWHPPGNCPSGATPEPGSGACFCGDGECRDVVTGQCRRYNPNREKVNETDDLEGVRPGGGGRGFCRQLDPGQQGRPGGGGGGGSAGMQGFEGIWEQLQAMLKNPSRYTPEILAQLQGQAKQREAGDIQTATDAAAADQVRRGIYSSPLAAALTQKAREPAAQNFNKSINDINLAKVNADAQDKMFAVQAMMQWVQMMMQSRQFDANLKLAYARLLQEWQMLQAQLSDPNRLLGGII